MTETQRKRRWFSFSIRDLLLLTVIVALAIGWWLDHRKLTKDNSTQLSLYYLAHGDAKVLLSTLQQLYAGNSDVAIALDPARNSIISRAPARQQFEIEALIKKFDVSPSATGNQTSGQ